MAAYVSVANEPPDVWVCPVCGRMNRDPSGYCVWVSCSAKRTHAQRRAPNVIPVPEILRAEYRGAEA